MAGRKLGPSGNSRRIFPKRAAAFNIISLFLYVCLLCQPASGDPASKVPSQWKASIERPTRGWDYDGKRILGHVGYDICLWDATTGKLLHRMKGHKEHIHAVQFSPDGNHALSTSWRGHGPMVWYVSKDTSTIVWNLATGRDREILKGEVAGEFSPDGKRIVTFSQRVEKQETSHEYDNPETGEYRLEKSIVPVFHFDTAAVWETYTGRQLVKAKLAEYSDHESDTLHFSPDGRRFVHVTNGGFLLYNSSAAVVFNTSDGREIGRVTREDVKFGGGHRYTSEGKLASFHPAEARLFNIRSGDVAQSLPHDLKRPWGVAWTHDGSRFAAIPSRGREITIGDMESGKTTIGAKTHPKGASRAIVSPDNKRLAIDSGGNPEDEPDVRLYNMSTGQEIARLKLPKWGHMIGFSPDSKTLLIRGAPFVIYSAENGKEIRSLNLPDDTDLGR